MKIYFQTKTATRFHKLLSEKKYTFTMIRIPSKYNVNTCAAERHTAKLLSTKYGIIKPLIPTLSACLSNALLLSTIMSPKVYNFPEMSYL